MNGKEMKTTCHPQGSRKIRESSMTIVSCNKIKCHPRGFLSGISHLSPLSNQGFTLIELLVVVLIIGILAAIALPQYQKAVLKSRYTTLMPIAKGIAEGNEAYFMEHGTYAEDPTELPIKGQESYPDGTTLDLQDTDEYTYVLASRTDLPGLHHIIYQHHSKNFPSETHCEAAKDNKLANWVCKDAFKGTKLGGSLTTGYNSYLLDGAGHGITATAAAVLAGVACADGVDEDHCKVTENSNGTKTKKECENPSDTTTCTWTTFNTDGTKSVCNGSSAKYANEVCIATKTDTDNPYEVMYDEDGETIIGKKECTSYDPNIKMCNIFSQYTYNEDGSYKRTEVTCKLGKNPTTMCGYGIREIAEMIHNEQGKMTSYRTCQNPLTASCAVYTGGEDWKYDDQGAIMSNRVCAEEGIPLTGDCTSYKSGYDFVENYDAQGNLSYVKKDCVGFTGTVCNEWTDGHAYRVPIYEDGSYLGYNYVYCDDFYQGECYSWYGKNWDEDEDKECPHGIDLVTASCI